MLYQQFFESLVKIKRVKIPELAGKAFDKETRTSKTANTKEF